MNKYRTTIKISEQEKRTVKALGLDKVLCEFKNKKELKWLDSGVPFGGGCDIEIPATSYKTIKHYKKILDLLVASIENKESEVK